MCIRDSPYSLLIYDLQYLDEESPIFLKLTVLKWKQAIRSVSEDNDFVSTKDEEHREGTSILKLQRVVNISVVHTHTNSK